MADRMAGIIAAGIPCMGHLGLTPQSASSIGGFRVQGKDAARAARIVEDATILEEAGAYSILLEMVPDRVCQLITGRAHIPIISLGSGPHANGQLLIFHDMFGLYPRFKPKMAKVYGNAGEVILNGVKQYVQEVQGRSFPQREHWFTLPDEAYDELLKLLKK
jgi:3-methyl-2-oxobutanoate hydroxymethyltransferase